MGSQPRIGRSRRTTADACAHGPNLDARGVWPHSRVLWPSATGLLASAADSKATRAVCQYTCKCIGKGGQEDNR